LDTDRNIFILDVLRRQTTPDKAVYTLFTLNERHSPSAVLIDDDPAAKVFLRLFIEIACHQRNQYVPISAMPLRGKDKETRASAIRGMFMQGNVYIKRATWNSELQAEIHTFPNGDHDDQIDCLSLIGRRVPQMSAPRPTTRFNALEEVICKDEQGQLFLSRSLDTLFDDHARSRPRRHRL
jgi:predicted phage terminase large subunit-like protein